MQRNMQTTQLKGLFNSRRSYSGSFHVVPIVMKTLPTEYIWEQLPHLELGHSDASQDMRRGEKTVSRLLETKNRRGRLFLETRTTRAGNHVPSTKKCKYTLSMMDGNVPLSLREEELNMQRSRQREKEVLVLGCLATGYLPKNHHPS